MDRMTPTRSRLPLLGAALATLGVLGVGCGMDLPQRNRVISIRPLALKVTVTGPLAPEEPDALPRAQALPLEQVTLQPFFGGPEGPVPADTLEPIWLACSNSPGLALGDCLQGVIDEGEIGVDDIPECDQVDFAMLDFEELPAPQNPCFFGAGEAEPAFTVPLNTTLLSGGEMEIHFIAGNPGVRTSQECLEARFRGEETFPDTCLLMTQRISIGPIENLILLAGEFGVDLGFPEPDPESIPEPDRHFEIVRFQVGEADEDNQFVDEPVDVAFGEIIEVPAGRPLRIEVEQPEDQLQTYPIPAENDTTVDRDEYYQAQWFRTWGSLLGDTSDDPVSFTVYTFGKGSQDETDVPPTDNETAYVYYVVRDSRAGVAWYWFGLQAAEE